MTIRTRAIEIVFFTTAALTVMAVRTVMAQNTHGTKTVQVRPAASPHVHARLARRSQSLIRVDGIGRRVSYDAVNQDVIVEGTSNEVTILGRCRTLRVSGSTNHIRVDSVGTIHVTGNGNSVFFGSTSTGHPPHINKTGDNQVSPF